MISVSVCLLYSWRCNLPTYAVLHWASMKCSVRKRTEACLELQPLGPIWQPAETFSKPALAPSCFRRVCSERGFRFWLTNTVNRFSWSLILFFSVWKGILSNRSPPRINTTLSSTSTCTRNVLWELSYCLFWCDYFSPEKLRLVKQYYTFTSDLFNFEYDVYLSTFSFWW